MPIFDYSNEESIGSVYSVDTGTVLVSVSNLDALRKLQVNHLIVLRSSRAGQHLIGLINKIMRKALVGVSENEDGEVQDDRVMVENIVRISLIGTLLDAVGTDQNVFRRTLETVPEIDAPCFVLSGEKLTGFMRAISTQIIEGQEPLSLGKYTLDEEANAWIDGNRFFQRHAVVVGSTGSGKSWTVARILEQVAGLPNASALLFDIHGEYAPLIGDGISHLRVAGPGDLDGARTLDDGVIFLPYWLLTYEEMLAMLLDRSDQNAPNQAMIFNREVLNSKRTYLESAGKDEILANFTIDSPVPYALGDVVDRLQELDVEMVAGAKTEKQGPFHGKLTRFVQRLQSKICDRRLGFLFSAGDDAMRYEWLEELATVLLGSTTVRKKGGVKIIDFSEVPSDILPLIIGLVARLVFSVQQWTEKEQRHPVALLCDEAHLYIPEMHETGVLEAGLRSFERIAKEGRKYGVGLTVISQRPAEVNRTVLSQCNNFVAMRLTNAEDQAVIRRLLPDTLGGFTDLLPILDIGEALVVGDAAMLPSRIRIDEPNNRPSSATVAFWDRWAAEAIENGIPAAVEALRKQRTRD
ncbi:MAG: ATPase [Deltaproteobacteria bacterium RBG_13_43_22]|nr:MAG: ATPase [Deltaproteobacteria bacterium RBG_13_43_22]